jgi:hypothetical protein
MGKRNRPLTTKQRRGLQDLLSEVEKVRFEAINHTAGRRAEGDRSMEYALKKHGDDLMVIGKDMTAERYEEIRAGLPADTRARLIGWRATGR